MALSTQLIVAFAIALFFFTCGFEVSTWHMKSTQLSAVNNALADYKLNEIKTAQETAKLNADNAKRISETKLTTAKLSKDIEKNPDIAKCKLGADVVRDWNSLH